jgi:polar amino acid transport system substrate-binding protein
LNRSLVRFVAVFLTLGTLMAGLSVSSVAASGAHKSSAAKLPLVNKGYLTFGTDATYPPMESINSNNNKFVGADIDLGKAIAKNMHLKAKFLNITFDALIPDLTGRHPFDAIISSMNDTASRRATGVAFVDYLKAVEAIVVQKSSSIHANNYSKMCGLSVSVEKGTTEADGLNAANAHCKNKIKISQTDTDTAAFQDFASRHVQAYTTDLPVAALYVSQSAGKYRLAGKPIKTGARYGVGMPKAQTALYAAVKKAFKSVRSSGQYLRIMKKWGVAGGVI